MIRHGRMRRDYRKPPPSEIGYTKRRHRCDAPIDASELPVVVRCMAAEIGRANRWKRLRNYFCDVTAAQWEAICWLVYLLDSHTCVYCGREAKTVDHLIPVSKGGSWHIENCVASCQRCNSKKGARTPNEAKMYPTAWMQEGANS